MKSKLGISAVSRLAKNAHTRNSQPNVPPHYQEIDRVKSRAYSVYVLDGSRSHQPQCSPPPSLLLLRARRVSFFSHIMLTNNVQEHLVQGRWRHTVVRYAQVLFVVLKHHNKLTDCTASTARASWDGGCWDGKAHLAMEGVALDLSTR